MRAFAVTAWWISVWLRRLATEPSRISAHRAEDKRAGIHLENGYDL